MVGEGGFEPPKREAGDLPSPGINHYPTHPSYVNEWLLYHTINSGTPGKCRTLVIGFGDRCSTVELLA